LNILNRKSGAEAIIRWLILLVVGGDVPTLKDALYSVLFTLLYLHILAMSKTFHKLEIEVGMLAFP